MNKPPFFGYIYSVYDNTKFQASISVPFLSVPQLRAKKTTCEVSDASTMTPGHLLLTSLLKSKVLTPRKDRVNLCHLTTFLQHQNKYV